MIEQRGRCKTCGTFEWQWDQEGGELAAHFDVDAYVCFGCERVEREVDRRKGDPPHPGLKLGFFPLDGNDHDVLQEDDDE